MTQDQLDILCVNTQIEIGLESSILKDLLEKKDTGALTYATKLMHLHGLMRSIKDFDITSEDLTDQQMFDAEAYINRIINEQNRFFDLSSL